MHSGAAASAPGAKYSSTESPKVGYFEVHFAVKRRMEAKQNRRRLVLLAVLALCLILSGLFAVFQAVSGKFLPHDEEFLGMRADDLCALQGCRIVHFMIHDRVSFG